MSPRGAKKGNRNALKHGLYARHLAAVSSDLLKMPVDEFLMELAALRFKASQAMDLYDRADDFSQKSSAIQIAGEILHRVINAVSKQQLISGDAPILQDLWTAIEKANEMDEITNAIQ